MKYYENSGIRCDPLHSDPEKLEVYRDQLHYQACYIDYISQ